MDLSKELKRDWRPKLQNRYARRCRQAKGQRLDDLCQDPGYERKYAIKLLRGGWPVPSAGAIPERRYAVVEPVVRQIWLTAEPPCGKRLVPVLRPWRPYYEGRYGQLSARQRSLIREVSPAPWTGSWPRPGPSIGGVGAGPNRRVCCGSEIPIRTGTWGLSRPGYWEADRVAHCGTSLAGSCIWSLTYPDLLSGGPKAERCGPKAPRAY